MDVVTEVPDPAALLFAQGTVDDPHSAYRLLRDRCPVGRSAPAVMGGVYISRYEDVCWVLRHPEVFSSAADALSIGQEQPLIPLQVDPPLHTSYRRLLNPPFTPKRIAELEPDVRVLVNRLLDGFADRGSCDFHEEFATPLPSTIFLRLMGLPLSDLPTFLRWRDDVIRPDIEPGDFDGAVRIREAAGSAINAYFQAAIEAARAQPVGKGLLHELVHADFEGRPLADSELLGICHLMLLGGLDTVTATLDCMITYLARHPDRRRAIVEDPGLIPAAVEELLRHQTPVMLVPRIVAQPVTLSGVELEVGELVMVVLGAANADDHEFADSGSADFGRDPNRHVAFGGGHHLCIGAHLARLELRVAMEELHRRVPEYRIADGADVHFSPGIRQAQGLPLNWRAAEDPVGRP